MRKLTALILAVIVFAAFTPLAYGTAAQTRGETLDSALNVDGGTLEFVSDGTRAWTAVEVDGRTAGRSGNIAVDNSTSEVSITVQMDVGDILSFDYRTSSEEKYDELIVKSGSTEILTASGETPWTDVFYSAPSTGSYTFKWQFVKDKDTAEGEDCAWIDNVYIGNPPELTGFTLDPATKMIGIGQTISIATLPIPEPAYIPEGEVEWTSSDESVATVSDGEVTGVKLGETTVTANYGGFSATAQITVGEGIIADGYVVTASVITTQAWTRFDLLPGTHTTLDTLPMLPFAAEYYDGNIYAYALDANTKPHFFVQNHETREYTERAVSAMVYDMAYDYTTETMFGLAADENGMRALCIIDLNTGALQYVDSLDTQILSFACSTDGQLYGVSSVDGNLYTVDKNTAAIANVGSTELLPEYVQSMAYDHKNGTLYWAYHSEDDNGIVSVSTETGASAMVLPNMGEICGLFFAYEAPQVDVVNVTGVTVSPETATVEWNGTVQLTATVMPENATNKGVIWSTSNPAVATVSGAGVVRGVEIGTVTITATTRDGAFTAECVVTVNAKPEFLINENFEGEFTGWTTIDADGDGFSWMQFDIEAYEGNYCAGSESYANGVGTLTPDNWLISPAFTATQNCKLVWYEDAQDPDYRDSYSVYIGAGDADSPSDFTESVFRETAQITWTERTIDLSEYAGQSIKIAFRHHDSSDKYILKIDKVMVQSSSGEVPPTPPQDQYTVTFVDWDDTVISEVVVNAGESATPPTPPTHEGYVFYMWDGDYTNVTANITVKATYKQIGDANLDDKVNTGDAVVILRYCVDDLTFEPIQMNTADMNGDSTVNTGDAVRVLVYCVS